MILCFVILLIIGIITWKIARNRDPIAVITWLMLMVGFAIAVGIN